MVEGKQRRAQVPSSKSDLAVSLLEKFKLVLIVLTAVLKLNRLRPHGLTCELMNFHSKKAAGGGRAKSEDFLHCLSLSPSFLRPGLSSAPALLLFNPRPSQKRNSHLSLESYRGVCGLSEDAVVESRL